MGTLCCIGIIAPGRRPCCATSAPVATACRDLTVRPNTEPLVLDVVVGSRGGPQLVSTAAHRAQCAVEVFLELRKLIVDVDVALAAEAVGPGMRGVDEPGGFGIRSLNHLGLRDQPGLLLNALPDGLRRDRLPVSTRRSASALARLVAASVVTLCRVGQPRCLFAGFGDHVLAVLTRPETIRSACDLASARRRSAPHARDWSTTPPGGGAVLTIESACSLASRRIESRESSTSCASSSSPGIASFDVVEQFEDIAAGNYAAGGHRHRRGLLLTIALSSSRASKTRYTAQPFLRSGCDQCAWCYACDCGGESVSEISPVAQLQPKPSIDRLGAVIRTRRRPESHLLANDEDTKNSVGPPRRKRRRRRCVLFICATWKLVLRSPCRCADLTIAAAPRARTKSTTSLPLRREGSADEWWPPGSFRSVVDSEHAGLVRIAQNRDDHLVELERQRALKMPRCLA